MIGLGIKISQSNQDVLTATSDKLVLNSNLNNYKIKQEKLVGAGEIISFDHGLGYFPFFLGYVKFGSSDPRSGNMEWSEGQDFVGVHSAQTRGYNFICYQFGIIQ